MNLAIDIGNTSTKIGIIKNNEVIYKSTAGKNLLETIADILLKYPLLKAAIISSVKKENTDLHRFLKEKFTTFIALNAATALPYKINYKTPHTLGKDRIAGIAGANNIYPDQNVLVIDVGTAITYDIITRENLYLGGNISPGVNIRYKALNDFTDNLPLMTMQEETKLIGNSTDEAIVSGVQNGVLFEIEAFINHFEHKFDQLKVIMTGGDASIFAKRIKSSIFVQPNLILIGLNRILEYNAKRN